MIFVLPSVASLCQSVAQAVVQTLKKKNVCQHLLSHSHNIFKEEVKFWAIQHPEKIEQNHGCDHVESYSVEKNS